jgi:hypothetical protein
MVRGRVVSGLQTLNKFENVGMGMRLAHEPNLT